MLKKSFAIVSAIISLGVVILGIYVANGLSSHASSYRYKEEKAEDIYGGSYDVDSARFGADFYSYMYEASATIVAELDRSMDLQNDIHEDLVELKNEVGTGNNLSVLLAEHMSTLAGFLIMAIGLASLSFSLYNVGKAFSVPCGNANKEKAKDISCTEASDKTDSVVQTPNETQTPDEVQVPEEVKETTDAQ